ncbi:Hly-III family protein [Rhodovulum sp. BSW8]|uniref:Hemolysin III n=1 Tax=Rhodovulum visakhapatnamense TaxID=364297 RepID=A0A4R8F852_9RHOB|nr:MULTISPECIES: hemolysin III family protein [Rhodovulum]OLS44148.1 Hly-III family protein [Rhodovulum sulfidophilum]MBL3571789.1 hemolysin III family protein [Rhodovulum visakhapatnamense]MBL3580279.1 hemolysin III family protein [Rhodovulum visakhapatnamense]RBO55100.1 Hly-III family protein [Rhodovulum sp. BSW8]TDX21616.1 hemolysin III [Rhodovulum visakhapatnamense]
MLDDFRAYTRAERLSDAVVHVTGLAAVAIGVPILVVLAILIRGDTPAVLGIAVYGAALFAMIGFSALYHMVRHPNWTPVFRRLDHSAIYWKIAGTYTPFTLLSGHGVTLLAGLWAAAAAGTGLRVLAPYRFRAVNLALYPAMGWAGAVAGWSMFATLSPPVLGLVIAGGVLYTVGMVFYLWERLPYHNTIWHVFVLVASMLFFAAITTHVVQTA